MSQPLGGWVAGTWLTANPRGGEWHGHQFSEFTLRPRHGDARPALALGWWSLAWEPPPTLCHVGPSQVWHVPARPVLPFAVAPLDTKFRFPCHCSLFIHPCPCVRSFAHSFSEQRSGGGGSHRYKAEGLWANYFICFLIGENEGATPPRAAGRVKGNNACVSSGWPAYRRVSVPPLLALPLSDPPVKLAEAPG